MKKISAEIIADSIDTRGNRITTVLATFPRFILAELNTHRMLSKNSASSRAIPFEKMVKMVEEDPFIPIAWQKDHKGMQGSEYIDVNKNNICYPPGDWLEARDCIVQIAKEMNADGVSKQIVNRMLEPFMWHTVLITATEWENFFNLRCPKYEYLGEEFRSKEDAINSYTFDVGFEKERLYLTSLTELDWIKISKSGAEIHIQALAEAIWDAHNESIPNQLEAGEWHMPFMGNFNIEKLLELSGVEPEDFELICRKIATARAARLSYMTFDGETDYEKDIQLHDRLLKSGHFSCFEHCARAMTDLEYYSFVKGRIYREIENNDYIEIPEDTKGWCNNFRGFIPYRYLIENKNE